MQEGPRYFTRHFEKQRAQQSKNSTAWNIKSNQPLHTVGYQIFPNAIQLEPAAMSTLKKTAQKASTIFNDNEKNKKNDRRRKQKNLPLRTAAIKAFDKQVKEFVAKHVNTDHVPLDPVVLCSEPGCQAQAAHSDYKPNNIENYNTDLLIPLALIVCLQEGTKLRVWPNSTQLIFKDNNELENIKPIHCQEVHLKPGDILVFRGDFIHAGSRYEERNIRVHYYLQPKEFSREYNVTHKIYLHACPRLQEIILPDLKPAAKIALGRK